MAENLGVGKATAQKIFVDLKDRGFVVADATGAIWTTPQLRKRVETN
jgi:DNA-binding transcriptional regulator YhcF (GntR family)